MSKSILLPTTVSTGQATCLLHPHTTAICSCTSCWYIVTSSNANTWQPCHRIAWKAGS